jgi:hypothetical protein
MRCGFPPLPRINYVGLFGGLGNTYIHVIFAEMCRISGGESMTMQQDMAWQGRGALRNFCLTQTRYPLYCLILCSGSAGHTGRARSQMQRSPCVWLVMGGHDGAHAHAYF